ncbi:MAG TPA: condensation domain-containing protein, partial [Thermoanaerobaculia bacterium]|nr:condensation domain-containing protein [Thermoanaerobaculia bacterium]
LGEIETALSALPGIREAVVVAREDAPGPRRLVAYVTGDVTAGELRRSLREQLPDYMVPAAFVVLEALPLNPNGKVDRKALPAPERQSAGESHVAPRTPVEEVLAGIWAELLGLERVGADDHFFELGGHSLLATQVTSRLRRVFGIELPLRELFEAPRLADLAARIAAGIAAARGQEGRGAVRAAPPVTPIAAALRQGPLPLSFSQQRLWFLDQLEPGSPLYNVAAALHVEGPLAPQVLALCLGEVVRRHEVLRTTFAAPQGAPEQVIRPAFPVVLSVVDLAGLPERARAAQARALAGEEAGRPFDLARGPLLRSLLLRPAEDDHIVVLTLHHIVGDGWSAGVLVREVAALYAAFTAGRPSPLPELPVQYADFAVWQRSWLQGEVLENELSFWRRQLADLPPRLELPIDRPRPSVQSFRGASRPVRLTAELTRQLSALSRCEGTTLFMVFLAGFQVLLARSSGQDDLAVGSPIAGRNRVEIEGLIGFFVNTLVLRGDLTGPPSFRELLARVRETTLAAHAHQDLPFERLVEELAPERSLAQAPLFQVMLVLQNAPAEDLAIQDLPLRPVSSPAATTKFDLTLSLVEAANGEILGAIEHATDLFDTTTIDRLILQYQRLLRTASAAPDLPISELPLLSTAERHQAVVEWNDTSAARRSTTLHGLLAARAAQAPDLPALVHGSEWLTYGELDARSDGLAAHLRALGVGPDVLVALFLERSLDLVVGLLAVLKAGGAYLPLEASLPLPRLSFLLADARAPLLLTRTRLLPVLPQHSSCVVCIDDLPAGAAGEGPAAQTDADHLAYVLYTSGSTGRPKGVAVTHRGLTNYLLWAVDAYPAGEGRGAPVHSPI